MFNTKKLKEIRLNNNLTQNEVATLLHTSRSNYAMWESNNNIIPIKHLLKFCNIFNTSLDYIFNLTSNLNYPNSSSYNPKLSQERLKELRTKNNLTQSKIASYLHIDQPTWSIYEHAKSIIGTPFLYMIATKYHYSADYLLGLTNQNHLAKEKINT